MSRTLLRGARWFPPHRRGHARRQRESLLVRGRYWLRYNDCANDILALGILSQDHRPAPYSCKETSADHHDLVYVPHDQRLARIFHDRVEVALYPHPLS